MKYILKQRPIGFRIWCIPAKAYCQNYKFNGKISKLVENKDNLEIWEQFTGIKDRKGKKIFEGDFVEFDYRCGDSNFLELTKQEKKLKGGSIKLIGLVKWSETNCGFDLICGDPEGNIRGMFCMGYCKFSKVVGNMLETPKMVNVSIEFFNEYMNGVSDPQIT